MKTNKIYFSIIALVLGLITSSCSAPQVSHGEHDDHDAEHGHEEHGDQEDGGVSLTTQQIDAISLELVKLEQRNMTIGVEVSGVLALAPQDKADISPMMGGIVKSIQVIEGDKVNKGSVLATLTHPDYIQLQQDYIHSLNSLTYNEKEFQRQKQLYDEKVISGRDFQQTKLEFENNKATVTALENKLQLLGVDPSSIKSGEIFSSINIVSPIDGTVSLVESNIGEFVEPMKNMFEIVNSDKLHADFRVYEKDIANVKVGQMVFFSTTSLPGRAFEGRIHAISPIFEDDPIALHLHADILNSKANLIPGMYLKGKIVAENVLTNVVPEQAIVELENRSYVFVRNNRDLNTAHTDQERHSTTDDHEGRDHAHHVSDKIEFKMVEVVTGISDNGKIEIKLLSPLSADAKIVGNGAYFLLAEMNKEEAEHSH